MSRPILIIGNAVVDVLAAPADAAVFANASTPVREIRLSYGGDALNEAVVLAGLGQSPTLLTKVGKDEAGRHIREYLTEKGVDTRLLQVDETVSTSVNLVLVDPAGERHFITNPSGSQRKLALSDILPDLPDGGGILSFASIFVSSCLNMSDMTTLFRSAKAKGWTLCADMTRPKNGERLSDAAEMLSCLDYFFPNESEIAALTGETDPGINAELLIRAGVDCAVIKRGDKGCLVRTQTERFSVPAHPAVCRDTTGAGDSFVAAFLHALSENRSLRECAALANAAGSLAVESLGATAWLERKPELRKRYTV